MTTQQMVLFAILFILAVGVCYAPALFLRGKKQWPRDEFIRAYPQFAWLRWDLWLQLLWLGVLLWVYVVLGNLFKPGAEFLYFFSTLLATYSLPDGLLTAFTGICRVPYHHSNYRYSYGESVRFIGQFQVITASLLTMVAILFASMHI